MCDCLFSFFCLVRDSEKSNQFHNWILAETFYKKKISAEFDLGFKGKLVRILLPLKSRLPSVFRPPPRFCQSIPTARALPLLTLSPRYSSFFFWWILLLNFDCPAYSDLSNCCFGTALRALYFFFLLCVCVRAWIFAALRCEADS